ncbi:MAG: hypothetical protein HKN44_13565, partial [Ilumatobacter sp.]|nr:hypothetical protein [Ilumatobacter sp.]
AQADAAGNVCFYTITTAHLIIDINGVTDTGITPIPNERTDTRGVPKPPPSSDFTYLYESSQPEAPYTLGGKRYLGWDPCSPITYAVNNKAGATPAQRAVLDQAILGVEQATGFDFQYVGEATGSLATSSIDANTPNGQAEAVFGFSNATFTPILGGSVIGIGGAGSGSGNNVELLRGKLYIVKGGYAIADLDDVLTNDELLGTMLHEIAHMVGLDHVSVQTEIMWDTLPNPPLTAFGVGDRNGLYNIGQPQCTAGFGGLTQAPRGAPTSLSIDMWRADTAEH